MGADTTVSLNARTCLRSGNLAQEKTEGKFESEPFFRTERVSIQEMASFSQIEVEMVFVRFIVVGCKDHVEDPIQV